MGLGNLGGGTQLLFGGSGGQDLFQKMTWILGAIFMFGSLGLAIMKTRQVNHN
jgi:protein translocase SecG subunit